VRIDHTNECPASLQVLTLMLMVLAAAMMEVAFTLPGQPLWPGLAALAGGGAVLIALNRLLDRGKQTSIPALAVLGTSLFVLAPFLPLPTFTDNSGIGFPLELRALTAFRNLGLALAVLSRWLPFLRLSGLISLFLVVFASCLSLNHAIRPLIGVYAALGSCWLMLVYWTLLPRHSSRSLLRLPLGMLLAVRCG
jgi:hypothetical protein